MRMGRSALNFNNAEATEYQALSQRYSNLTALAMDKGCDIKVKPYPELSQPIHHRTLVNITQAFNDKLRARTSCCSCGSHKASLNSLKNNIMHFTCESRLSLWQLNGCLILSPDSYLSPFASPIQHTYQSIQKKE